MMLRLRLELFALRAQLWLARRRQSRFQKRLDKAYGTAAKDPNSGIRRAVRRSDDFTEPYGV